LKVSIITAVYNNVDTVENAVRSFMAQDYPSTEYIVIDGKSDDGTVRVLEEYNDQIDQLISEPDQGMYDALNKGIKIASGDIIGILNADDIFENEGVVSEVVDAFKNEKVDCVFGDVAFVKSTNPGKIIRYYSSSKWHPKRLAWGYMPAHPSVFVKKEVFKQYGYYKTDYQIAADYEWLIRILKVNRCRYRYLNKLMVRMRMGGKSTRNLNSNIILNREILRACRENNLSSNYFKIYSKYLWKMRELL